jgi:microcystin-dependent protein
MALDFPSLPTQGQVYDNFYYDSVMVAWRAIGSATDPQIPTGVISQFAGVAAPAGYLRCMGQSILASEYASLFSVIGYTYGGSGQSFIVPNLQGRVPVGIGSETEFDTLGEIGGAKTVALTSAQMPSHSHTGTTNSSGNHTHTASVGVTGADDNNHTGNGDYVADSDAAYRTQRGVTVNAAGAHTHTFTTAVTGSDAAHTNLQPYIVVNYIIKT